MEKPIYEIEVSDDALVYEFESTKNVKKRIIYFPEDENAEIYQLIFGDLLPNGKIDVFAVSGNDDMKIIISTVIASIAKFFEKYPTKTVIFTGSTQARTRLYRAVISKVLVEAELYYQIFGISNEGELVDFDKNKSFDGYLISKKIMKKTGNIFNANDFKFVVNKNMLPTNLDDPQIIEQREKVRQLLRNLKQLPPKV